MTMRGLSTWISENLCKSFFLKLVLRKKSHTMQMTMYSFQEIDQTSKDIRERNLSLWREVHARKAGESS